jgi:hypothetical protein
MPYEAQCGSRSVAVLILNFCAIWGCGVNATSRPLYSAEGAPITHFRESWFGPRAGLHAHEKKTYFFTPALEPQTAPPPRAGAWRGEARPGPGGI